MKRVVILLLLTMSCASCSALPAEEKAFAVVLYVEKNDGVWQVHGRVPTYQSGGGYLTVTGEGDTLTSALADMEASAPMAVHLSQLRMLVLNASLGRTGDLTAALMELAQRADMRPQCAVAATETPSSRVLEALQPAAGTRLSKAVDVLLESRAEQGVILAVTLADVVRMGERQSPVLIGLTVEDNAISLSGGWPVNQQGKLGAPLQPEEIALLSMVLGRAKNLHLSLAEGQARVRDISAHTRLMEDLSVARVEVTMTATDSSFTAGGLEQALANACLTLFSRLSAEGCDVLGLGRQAVLQAHDMAQWHAMSWPEKYRSVRWEIAAGAYPPA